MPIVPLSVKSNGQTDKIDKLPVAKHEGDWKSSGFPA
jgi:hypothetical protein